MAQARVTDEAAQEQLRIGARSRMVAEMERQLEAQAYYVPFGPVRMVVAKRGLARFYANWLYTFLLNSVKMGIPIGRLD